MFPYAKIIDVSYHSELQLFWSSVLVSTQTFIIINFYLEAAFAILHTFCFVCIKIHFISFLFAVIYQWFFFLSILLNVSSFWVSKTFPGVCVCAMSWPLNDSHFLICWTFRSWKILVLDFCCCGETPEALHSLRVWVSATGWASFCVPLMVDRTVSTQRRTSKCHCIPSRTREKKPRACSIERSEDCQLDPHLCKVSSPPIIHLVAPREHLSYSSASTKKFHFLKCLL